MTEQHITYRYYLSPVCEDLAALSGFLVVADQSLLVPDLRLLIIISIIMQLLLAITFRLTLQEFGGYDYELPFRLGYNLDSSPTARLLWQANTNLAY